MREQIPSKLVCVVGLTVGRNMYFAGMTTSGGFVVGQLALTATVALAFMTSVNDAQIEFRDEDGRPVGEDQLRSEASDQRDR